ncbi:MAG TPA: XRE family transcriptional regulator [Bryobacteraceae bacterium]|nr:XRE family transcriptional regulator [Bryobacteraceae bacterium]
MSRNCRRSFLRRLGSGPGNGSNGNSRKCRCTSCGKLANLPKKQMAETLQVEQPAISKMEKRTDLYLSTLRNFIEAMNGELEVRAVFPDGAVIVDLSERVEPSSGSRP